MDLDKTRPLSTPTQQFYRCPCGNDVRFDPGRGGKCKQCGRIVPASITTHQLSLTMTTNAGQAPRGASADDDMIGKELGHFEIISMIGHGGMGQVYRALDTSLQRYVAVKVLRGSLGALDLDSVGQQQLLHEAVAQARVNHPNIVTIYFVGRESGTPFFAMELVDGQDAAQMLSNGPLPYARLANIAMQITHALDTAAQLGIVHGDIKPHNLLILPNGDTKLSDFGMARIVDADDQMGFGGTPNYLAPEVLRGAKPTVQSDMYALGVTLYEMTFGRLPLTLSGNTVAVWSEIHAHSEITFPDPWPDHLPASWQTILERLLDKHPEKRYASYQELGSAIYKILPSPRSTARLLPRAIAFGIDFTVIMLVLLTVELASPVVAGLIGVGSWSAVLSPLLGLGVMLLYTVATYQWRHALGHELLHIQVINQYGLIPTRRKSALRSATRMILPWSIVLGQCLAFAVPSGFAILALAGLLFFVVDVIVLVFVGRGRSLHDYIFKTRVVIGDSA